MKNSRVIAAVNKVDLIRHKTEILPFLEKEARLENIKIHRDFQSRNIMILGDRHYLIDFQGARKGPIQYDLASLLIDPYVELPDTIQTILRDYCMEALSKKTTVEPDEFRRPGTRHDDVHVQNLDLGFGRFADAMRQSANVFHGLPPHGAV